MPTVLITGAGHGIGHELANRAVARKDTVFAVVRRGEDASRFAPAPNLHVIVMDVADTRSVAAGFEQVDSLLSGEPLNAIVHAAGISRPSAIELAPVAEFEQALNTNALGSLRVLKAAIPRLRGHGGRLLILTSLWGKTSGALLGAYCASKHAIESLADTARRETAGMNLHIVVIEPGVVRTSMLSSQPGETQSLLSRMSNDEELLYGSLYRRYVKLTAGADRTAISTTRCAEHIEKALFAPRPRTRYRVGTDSKIVCFLAWLLPDRLMDALMGLTLNRKPLPPTWQSPR